MALFTPDERSFAKGVRDLVKTNPFHPDWRVKERALLGLPARDTPEVIHWKPGAILWGPQAVYPYELDQKIADLHGRLCGRLQAGEPARKEELDLYEILSFYSLYCNHGREMDEFIAAAVRDYDKRSGKGRTPRGEEASLPDIKTIWEDFEKQYNDLFPFNRGFPRREPEHLFACFFVFRRAFWHIFFNIVGTSEPITKLRSKVWESIVTRDWLAWMQELHQQMKDFPTLITGPSGTGKERVAEAIGRSQYIRFDPKEKTPFAVDFLKAFQAVHLAALAPALIESELFGHVKGAFNGAIDRVGRLEACPENGALFLDEIGELAEAIQVKLLRVLQKCPFQRVGSIEDKVFRGRIIAATNCDLPAKVQAGLFREDFYYRICCIQITTPSLGEQLRDRPDDLRAMVEFVCRSVVGEEKADRLDGEVVDWIEKHPRLGRDYAWRGNFRELEQCVRSYTICKEYHPLQPSRPCPADDGSSRPPCDPVAEACKTLAEAALGGELKFEEIKRRLFTLVRRGTPTAKEAAKRLGLRDSRTVNAHSDWTSPGEDDRP